MQRKPRLLIAEDENLVALSLEMFLTGTGHDICGIATSAAEEIRLVTRPHPALLLMDVRLAGGSDGMTAIRAIYQGFGAPSILLTSATETDDPAQETGVVAILRKPCDPGHLTRTIAVALHRCDTPSSPEAPK
ncbi:MAG: PAS domain S-box [Rhodospirillaceae bacterium]|nr:MAG: PAS domain S-box [Rhodospirillaceae bacterium]